MSKSGVFCLAKLNLPTFLLLPFTQGTDFGFVFGRFYLIWDSEMEDCLSHGQIRSRFKKETVLLE